MRPRVQTSPEKHRGEEEDLAQADFHEVCLAPIGFSHAQLDFVQNKFARFHGYISRKLPEDRRFKRSGYAMIRSRKPAPQLILEKSWDSTPYRYLAIRVRADHRTYLVNLYTEVVVKTDMYQHRLIARSPGQWETVVIPFNEFALTSNGVIVPAQTKMYRQKMESVGFSLSDGREGSFCLDIAWVKAINSINTDGDSERIPQHRNLTWRSANIPNES
ncbi:hypothetical protein EV182_001572 [Spiromyces aspiralis]|uniref:Uncharacterized protein n=1 Tax=Spiromyces aspiralis TaxID=68401 RepID=A0ACC1HIZ5_9FUNG|nr:hypothetical protein EV182_001572 [Spiromyces aspiralis]